MASRVRRDGYQNMARVGQGPLRVLRVPAGTFDVTVPAAPPQPPPPVAATSEPVVEVKRFERSAPSEVQVRVRNTCPPYPGSRPDDPPCVTTALPPGTTAELVRATNVYGNPDLVPRSLIARAQPGRVRVLGLVYDNVPPRNLWVRIEFTAAGGRRFEGFVIGDDVWMAPEVPVATPPST